MANTLIFFAQKMSSYLHFCSKNITVFENTLATTVKKLVKLMKLLTTGPSCNLIVYRNL